MKVVVTNDFRDVNTKDLRVAGDEIEVDDERGAYLIKKGFVQSLEANPASKKEVKAPDAKKVSVGSDIKE